MSLPEGEGEGVRERKGEKEREETHGQTKAYVPGSIRAHTARRALAASRQATHAAWFSSPVDEKNAGDTFSIKAREPGDTLTTRHEKQDRFRAHQMKQTLCRIKVAGMRAPVGYRGTSLIRNSATLGPYSRNTPRALWWSYGGGRFLMSEVPL